VREGRVTFAKTLKIAENRFQQTVHICTASRLHIRQTVKMKVGVIGSGKMGRALGGFGPNSHCDVQPLS